MMNDLEKPKFYSNHRYRQDQKKEKYSESHNNLKELLINGRPNIVDIGFGTGASTKQLHSSDKSNYIGIESYMHGINNLTRYIKTNKIDYSYSKSA